MLQQEAGDRFPRARTVRHLGADGRRQVDPAGRDHLRALWRDPPGQHLQPDRDDLGVPGPGQRGAGFRGRYEPLPHRADSPAQWKPDGSPGGARRERLLQESGGPGSRRDRPGGSDPGAWRARVHAGRGSAAGRVRQVPQSATERPAQHAPHAAPARRLRADAGTGPASGGGEEGHCRFPAEAPGGRVRRRRRGRCRRVGDGARPGRRVARSRARETGRHPRHARPVARSARENPGAARGRSKAGRAAGAGRTGQPGESEDRYGGSRGAAVAFSRRSGPGLQLRADGGEGGGRSQGPA